MEIDLIDRNALLETCHLIEAEIDDGIKVKRTYGILLSEVRDAKTIDAKPVMHGHWIVRRGTMLGDCCTCSVCGSCPSTTYKYCPYCGSTMDEEAQELT